MAKTNKFGVLNVPLNIEYTSPILGQLVGIAMCLMLLCVKKFNITMNNKPICSFYRLIVPRFVKGGGVDEE